VNLEERRHQSAEFQSLFRCLARRLYFAQPYAAERQLLPYQRQKLLSSLRKVCRSLMIFPVHCGIRVQWILWSARWATRPVDSPPIQRCRR
jgi:hypothetical protein